MFQYSYKLWYSLLCKIWNSFFFKRLKSYLILDLNIFSTDWLNYSNLNFYETNVNKLSFFKKYILSVYPDIHSTNYNYSNDSVLYLSNFRENNFPIINEIVENNFYKNHKSSLKDLNKLGNFLIKINFSNSNFSLFLSKNLKSGSKHSKIFNFFLFNFFLENNFYYFLTFKHFNDISKRNFVKFNFLFLTILKNLKHNVYVNHYDLNNFSDWYNFINDDLKYVKTNTTPLFFKNNNYENIRFDSLNQSFLNSLNNVANFNKNLNAFVGDLVFNFKLLNNKLFNLNNNLSNSWKINFSESSTNKHISLENNFLKRSNYSFFFLRKSKIFNKGRYSRNRQTYRTGFYWCLWLNIFAIYGLHYAFYRFTFTFGYLWIFLIIFFGSFVFGRMLKYNFHNYKYAFAEVSNFFNWIGFISNNFYFFLLNFFDFFKKFFSSIPIFSNISNKSIIFSSIYTLFNNFFFSFKKNLNTLEHTHIWYYLSAKDESFLKLSSKIFFLNQFFFKK